MRLAVISDIHGNLEAFQQVLEDIESCRVDGIVSLGDNVGYGADSQEVVSILRERAVPSVMGNHELALMDPGVLDWFNPSARKVILKIGKQLNPETLDWIKTLPDYMVLEGCRLVHGFPPDSVTGYLSERSNDDIQRAMSGLAETVCFCGHTHQLDLYLVDDHGVHHAGLAKEKVQLDPGAGALVNAGSVGQPRDSDPHAKYIIYDSAGRSLEVRYVPYDIPAAQAKIRALGFPKFFASRLGSPLWDLPLLDSGQ